MANKRGMTTTTLLMTCGVAFLLAVFGVLLFSNGAAAPAPVKPPITAPPK